MMTHTYLLKVEWYFIYLSKSCWAGWPSRMWDCPGWPAGDSGVRGAGEPTWVRAARQDDPVGGGTVQVDQRGTPEFGGQGEHVHVLQEGEQHLDPAYTVQHILQANVYL